VARCRSGGADERRGWLVMFIGPARIISPPHPRGLRSSIGSSRARSPLSVSLSAVQSPRFFSSSFRATPFPPHRRRSFLYIRIYIGIYAHHHPPVNLKRVSHNFCHVFRIYIHKGVLYLHTKPYTYIYTQYTPPELLFLSRPATELYLYIYIYILCPLYRGGGPFPH